MIRLNAIPMDLEPRQKIVSRLSAYSDKLEKAFLMDEFDSAFLCGVLKTFRPKKILEVGVAAGASTAIILQALEDIGAPYEMHSIDLFAKHWYYTNADMGFLATFAKEKNLINPDGLSGTHEFHLGKILPQVIDEIGGDIDFVILDTIHRLPGEVLDFLTVLPYLTDNAVVVLHDVLLHQTAKPIENATGVLFGAVSADKFLNFQADDELFRYPNIAAFKVNEHTTACVDNLFVSLILNWNCFFNEQIFVYREHFRRFYSDALMKIFQESVDINGYNRWILAQENRD